MRNLQMIHQVIPILEGGAFAASFLLAPTLFVAKLTALDGTSVSRAHGETLPPHRLRTLASAIDEGAGAFMELGVDLVEIFFCGGFDEF